jgi:BlaI family transcriptional regulator, penicillinase repressor
VEVIVANPEGKLTSAQYEILEVVWAAGPAGASVTEVWEAVAAHRSVTRTTVLNLVGRLEKRGWLRRQKDGGSYRYLATVDRETTARQVAEGVVDEFFGGSAGDLVMSLLGSQRLKPEDVERLRRLLDDNPGEEPREGEK